MRRQDKYPDTATFHFHNQNPHNRMTGDCVYRAVSLATGLSWEDTVRGLAETAIETGYSPASKENMSRYLKSLGFAKHKQPRKDDGTKFTGDDFCGAIQFILSDYHQLIDKRIIVNIGGHHVAAIVNGKVWDIWDSTDGCIGNYWVKD